jgi:hypothetical protein
MLPASIFAGKIKDIHTYSPRHNGNLSPDNLSHAIKTTTCRPTNLSPDKLSPNFTTSNPKNMKIELTTPNLT